MKRKHKGISTRRLLSLCTIMLLILLLTFPKASLHGAEKGILLWFNVIVPTLLPFIIVSHLIVNLRLTTYIAKVFYPFLHHLFAVTKHGCYVIIIGLLTGFPVGAKACGDLVTDRMITKKEGQYLLTFCNNASPMFIISFIAITTLNIGSHKYMLLALIYISALLTAIIYRCVHKISTSTFIEENKTIHSKNLSIASLEQPKSSRLSFAIVDHAILDGFEVITKVGGYIILFSILSSIILSVTPANNVLSYTGVGFLEITNGINAIGDSTLALSTKIALILSLTSFGGLSSVAQTKSVIDESGLSIKCYTLYKLLNACITFVLVVLFLQLCSL